MFYTQRKTMFVSSEYMLMGRKTVLSKQRVQDISVDHEKMPHNQN